MLYPCVQGEVGWSPGLPDLVAGSAHSRAVGTRWALDFHFQPKAFYVSLKSAKYLQYQQLSADTGRMVKSKKRPSGVRLSDEELKQEKERLKTYKEAAKKYLSAAKRFQRGQKQYSELLEYLTSI